MPTKKKAEQVEKKQKELTRSIIAAKLNQLIGEYKSKASADDFGKALKKASKLLSKVIIVPLPTSKVVKKTAPKKAAAAK